MAEHVDATGLNDAAVLDAADHQLEGSDQTVRAEGSGDVPVAGERARRRLSVTGTAVVVGLVLVVALGTLVGWLGLRQHRDRQSEAIRSEMVDAARVGAANLTNIDFARVDADIERILDSSIGSFHDDFQQRSQPFIDVVKQAQSKSEGTVTSAGLESQDGDRGRVLVAVSVKTSSIDAPQQQPRAWRMRIDVQKVDGAFKVSDVQFVP
ncbi:hypothetical protein AU184_25920 [Mycolicibacterium novocastrense]|nr:hypothetical protein AU072_18375 [Mycolicibacterium novocastrense]KUH71189.1 hypothetical protein AU183_20300 [Mycolicibacterium novocastrense]KUH73363.1 hypothetical protein AU184_25920 [Mycolicibacterium novocastrense]